MNFPEQHKSRMYVLEDTIGYKFNDITHLFQALIHKSYVNETRDPELEDNERYEFLGDAVLEYIITKHLFESFPDEREGSLTLKRSYYVNRDTCARLARKLHLGHCILLGRGEREQGRGMKRSILANAFEALVCAVYLDGGMDVAQKFVLKLFEEHEKDLELEPMRNFKSELQNYVQRKYQKIPLYKDISATGPDHEKIFEVSVVVNHRVLGRGKGSTKKIAQQEAAKTALDKIAGHEEAGKDTE